MFTGAERPAGRFEILNRCGAKSSIAAARWSRARTVPALGNAGAGLELPAELNLLAEGRALAAVNEDEVGVVGIEGGGAGRVVLVVEDGPAGGVAVVACAVFDGEGIVVVEDAPGGDADEWDAASEALAGLPCVKPQFVMIYQGLLVNIAAQTGDLAAN